ncbi:MAG: serine--glyoxylate aminotransferase, partial [Methylococcaceae bacterium]|nr:serine--glyoxylate aminotransferase [Methylococcaceae bacterium]
GHVGDMNDVSLLGAIAGVEMALLDSGIDIKPGSGVAAAIEYYRATAK